MRHAIVLAAVALASGQVTSMVVVNQTESIAVYTTAAVSHHPGGTPTFAAATWLNQPVMVEAFSSSDAVVFQYIAPTAQWSYAADMARHASAPGREASYTIDMFALGFDGTLGATGIPNCTIQGFYSTGPNAASGVPAWTMRIPACTTDTEQDGMGAYIALESSDDGSSVAFLAYVQDSPSANATARVVVMNGQTGTMKFMYELVGVRISQASVAITPNGAFTMFLMEDDVNSGHIHVIDATGTLRGEVLSPFFIAAAISDDGNTLAVGDDGVILLYKWTSSGYTQYASLAPPNGGSWICWDLQFGSLTDGTPVAVVGYISGDVKTIRVTAFDASNSSAVLDWVSPTNAQFQNNPSIRCEGVYCGLALWGDSGNEPTAVVLQIGSAAPIFSAITPGSMFSVDLVVDTTASSPTMDVVYLAVGGKAVPANQFGNGGQFLTWKINVPK